MSQKKGIELIKSQIELEVRRLKQDLDMVNTFLEKGPMSSMTETRLRMAEDIELDIIKLKKALEVL